MYKKIQFIAQTKEMLEVLDNAKSMREVIQYFGLSSNGKYLAVGS